MGGGVGSIRGHNVYMATQNGICIELVTINAMVSVWKFDPILTILSCMSISLGIKSMAKHGMQYIHNYKLWYAKFLIIDTESQNIVHVWVRNGDGRWETIHVNGKALPILYRPLIWLKLRQSHWSQTYAVYEMGWM